MFLRDWEERDSKHFVNQKVNKSAPDHNSFVKGYEFMKNFIRENDVVLDAGCKWDRGSPILVDSCKLMYCVDRDKSRLENAEARNGERDDVIYLHKDSLREKIPECDVLVTTSLFHHYPQEEIPNIFRKLSKTVSRDVMIFCPNGATYPKKKFNKTNNGDHVYHPTIYDLESAGNFHGFVLHSVYYDHYPNLKNHFCIVLRKASVINVESNNECLVDY